ncbi:hypothetical protein ACHHYP_17123 [Achlya hypogyna]|uniref:DUF4209 domain-containing protein n=1 Tax=Achlya hypogyna TaxID=1202772 RepID=A0A1V9Y559_ACHHY|nr:hypothetical protein ACHHYP_17123 [Achlya hypogyna]
MEFYRPAVAAPVHEALYGIFSRNVAADMARLAHWLPARYVLGAQLPWADLAAAIAAGESPNHGGDCAWTVAISLDTRLRADVTSTCTSFETLSAECVHGPALCGIVVNYWANGHHYTSFTLLVTALERALYDLYARENAGVRSNMILRDLLQSPELTAKLPPGLLALLRVLFLPSGLNLRNLVWHGFLAPIDVPGCFASLLLMLLADPALRRPVDAPLNYVSLTEFTSNLSALYADAHRLAATMDVAALFTDAPVQSKSRQGLVQQATDAYLAGNSLMSLFFAIPVLEYLIRCEFVRVNPSVPRGMAHAQLTEYYSTLDGFGQRTQHQVLLARHLFESQATNQLYDTLPTGALNACVDLFMCAAGPNVRAKLCHGEVDLVALWSVAIDKGATSADICASLVLLVVYQLLRPTTDGELALLAAYQSQFHPYAMLQAELSAAAAALCEFRKTLHQEYTFELAPSAPGMTAMTFTGPQFAPDALPVIMEATVRMLPAEIPGATSKTVPDAIAALSRTLAPFVAWLEPSWFARQDDALYEQLLPALDLRVFGEGVPAAACMLGILQACQRHLGGFTQRRGELLTQLTLGSARTSHRRSLVTCVVFQHCFERMLSVVLAMIERWVAGCARGEAFVDDVPRKLLQFIVAFEDDKKSIDKLLKMAIQFWSSKALRRCLPSTHPTTL